MTTLVTTLTDAMVEILKVQERLNILKAKVAEEMGVGTWAYEHQGSTWVLRIVRKIQGRSGSVVSEVSLTRANKL